MGGYPGGGGYAGGGGFRGGRDNEPEVSLEDLLENIEVMKQNIRDMKVLHLPCTSLCCIPALCFMSGVQSQSLCHANLATIPRIHPTLPLVMTGSHVCVYAISICAVINVHPRCE